MKTITSETTNLINEFNNMDKLPIIEIVVDGDYEAFTINLDKDCETLWCNTSEKGTTVLLDEELSLDENLQEFHTQLVETLEMEGYVIGEVDYNLDEDLSLIPSNDMSQDLKEMIEYINPQSKEELLDYLNNDDNNYISDSISERVDNHIDIYYYDLRKWSVDNFNYIDEAIADGLCISADFHQHIQAGQYLYYTEMFNDLIHDYKNELEG